MNEHAGPSPGATRREDVPAKATPGVDAVLFDLDGTILDSVPLILDSFRHTFDAHRMTPPAPAEIARGLGIPLSSYFASLGCTEPQVERLIATYRAYNEAHHDVSVRAFPGVCELMGALHRAGVRMALVTSKRRGLASRGLELIGLRHLVDVVIGCDDVERPKPDPEPVLRALERMGVGAARAVFVGDSLHDLHCGRAAGVRTAAALWGPFSRDELDPGRPDYWLHRPADLLELVVAA